MICWKCNKEIDVQTVFRNTECPLCHADLHCCKACRFYAPGSPYDCKEKIDSPVTDKDKSNFCDFFMANTNVQACNNDDKVQAARSAAAALFGEKSPHTSDSSSAAKNAFNSLFGD